MGYDITIHAEKRVGTGFVEVPLDDYWYETYAFYGFLGGVRTWRDEPTPFGFRGLPDDTSEVAKESINEHCCATSWVGVNELLSFDYQQKFTDLDTSETLTVAEHLDPSFFDAVDRLVASGADRLVYGFA
ncbi:hypothetical protein O9X99_02015 [Agrobacterium salinitolerans]|uniref:Uncharacterized protein n=1 Tax=Agrobacterium salinitolerans TaxID=1183413 RepID=A0ABY3BUU9_9HYPH|nr:MULTISPECIES: hypothetical protein [Agrobacterium]MCZ7890443.1 hypothetical protein [Agrobacterium salinitolerans]TRA96835.1 hypothetical protein EXN23_00940 [Agrobacterium salinitolerans]